MRSPPAQIVLGNGSNDILELVSLAFLEPGDAAVYAQHAFAVYPLATQARGATGIEVPAKDFGHDLAAMRAAITPRTRVVFVANPNNPTGTWLPPAEVEAFVASVPRDVVVVLDEAYNEYLDPPDRAPSVAWVAKYPNLIVSRTFSKAYGLAALRVGYGVMDAQVADIVNRVRQPFNVNAVAQAAAVAALDDTAYVDESRELNRAGLAQLVDGLAALGPAARAHARQLRAGRGRRGGARERGAAEAGRHRAARGQLRPAALAARHRRAARGERALPQRAGPRAPGVSRALPMAQAAIRKLVVVGVGLIGGSVALALRSRGAVGEVVGVGRSQANLDDALAAGVVDRDLHARAGLAGRDRGRGRGRRGRAGLAVPVALRRHGPEAVAHGRRDRRRQHEAGRGRGGARPPRAWPRRASCRRIRSPAPSTPGRRRPSPRSTRAAG